MKDIHPNSEESLHTFEFSGDREKREQAVLKVYRVAARTDRQVAEALGFADMNAVRPVITRLKKKKGLLIEVGSTICGHTGRKVRLCALRSHDNGERGPLE